MSLFDIAARGGWIMLIIALCSVAALAISIERFITLRKIRINARTFVLQIQNDTTISDCVEKIEAIIYNFNA